MNPYEVIPPDRPNLKLAKLWLVLSVHRALYFIFVVLGFLFYWRSDATSVGELFAWVGIIGFLVDIFASLAAESLYNE